MCKQTSSRLAHQPHVRYDPGAYPRKVPNRSRESGNFVHRDILLQTSKRICYRLRATYLRGPSPISCTPEAAFEVTALLTLPLAEG